MGLNLGLSGVPFYGHDIGGFFGDAILVIAPVKAECGHFPVYLPEGSPWYDPFEKRLRTGRKSYRQYYPLEGVRYLIQSGSIVPTTDHAGSLKDAFFRNVHFRIFPDTG